MTDDSVLTTVHVADNDIEAGIVSARLQADRIRCVLVPLDSNTTGAGIGQSQVAVRVVAESEAAALAALDASALDDEPGPETYAGAKRRKHSLVVKLAALALFIATAGAFVAGSVVQIVRTVGL